MKELVKKKPFETRKQRLFNEELARQQGLRGFNQATLKEIKKMFKEQFTWQQKSLTIGQQQNWVTFYRQAVRQFINNCIKQIENRNSK